ncbi:MAG: molybdopterin-dependent oxidoreductase, partial [Treponema sp.]|nr:molybdopterin-dependent oxidoreductase [Treponema sp.]
IAKAAAGNYKLGRIKLDAAAVAVNLPPASPFAGFGAAQGIFALERHIAKIAGTLGVDAAEWRKNHYNEKKIPSGELEKLTETLMDQGDYRRKWAAYELLRRRAEISGEKIQPMRGIGIMSLAYEYCYPHYNFDDIYGAKFLQKKDAGQAGKPPPLTAAIIELEIDLIDFSPKIRSIWMSVCTGKLIDSHAVRRALIQNIICALGWTAYEKLDYEEGKIHEDKYLNYCFATSAPIPRINLFLSESSHKENHPELISELPYCVIPAAYLQALTQACNHHFESIPALARDVCFTLDGHRQELQGE